MTRTEPQAPPENPLTPAKSWLLLRPGLPERAEATQALADAFFGQVIQDPAALPADLRGHRVYACGDLRGLTLDGAQLLAVEGLFIGVTENSARARVVRPGQVPRAVHGLGVLVPELFADGDLFTRISTEHAFQRLTEGSKPSQALRTGIYLSEVRPAGPDALRFHLMRCSSNLTGPTDNLREADRQILSALNALAASLFEREVSLNHVLAQIYWTARADSGKPRKAKIGAHSDKTKDMHPDGVMAFCSFYKEDALARLLPSPTDPFDRVHGKQSGLARLVFKLKEGVEGPVEAFTVPLYPSSVLLIPLSTNRLYTHEIRPSALDIDQAPTRMGYVVRCSACEAEHRDGQTFVREGGAWVPLQPMRAEGARELRARYFQENTSDAAVDYGAVHFSMNAGDYLRPIL